MNAVDGHDKTGSAPEVTPSGDQHRCPDPATPISRGGQRTQMWRMLLMTVTAVAIVIAVPLTNGAIELTPTPTQPASTASGPSAPAADAPLPGTGTPPDTSLAAAHATIERFARNFASPNGDHSDWLQRISGDVMPELLEQYRLTDIRNLPQATVAATTAVASDTVPSTYQVLQIQYSDGFRMEVVAEITAQGWKVSTVEPVESPPPPTPAVAGPPLPMPHDEAPPITDPPGGNP